MKIAFVHNLKQKDTEEHAEFDTPETVAAIQKELESLDYEVGLFNVNASVQKILSNLENWGPDLVFNTAEGTRGRFREGLYPALFEHLEIPYTGSDAYVCTLTLDKFLSKKLVESIGVLVPQGVFVKSAYEVSKIDFQFPVILKPNFEGSSKGISQKSIVEDSESLKERARELLKIYPQGILIEEFIEGKDIAVPFIEGAATQTHGILPPIEYLFSEKIKKDRKYMIYDYELKNNLSREVDVQILKDFSKKMHRNIAESALKIIKIFGIRDFGRIDFRITPDEKLYFIEVNALPSLEPGAGIYLSAQDAQLKEVKDVLNAIIGSAQQRYHLRPKKKNKLNLHRFGKVKVGFTYNEKRIVPSDDTGTDNEAEYDSPKTLNAIREAIESYGYEVINLEATPELPHLLSDVHVDVVFNIAEGIKGRNREAQIPSLLELLNIPYTGSDPAALSITLDKGLAKRVVVQNGIHTPEFQLFVTGNEKLKKTLHFPLMVKPVAEGSSKGVVKNSVAKNEEELRTLTKNIISRYRQAALVEAFLPGREFTVAVLGEKKLKILPPMEIVYLKKDEEFPIYTYHHKLDPRGEVRYDAPARLDENLQSALEKTAKKVFQSLGCRDVARIDLRLDEKGHVHFIECNPLPGLTPGWSDICLIADSIQMDYRTLIGEILNPALKRMKNNAITSTS